MITSPDGSRSALSRALNLVGVAVVAFVTWREFLPRVDLWVMVLVWLSLACWVAVILLPRRHTGVDTALLGIMVLTGAAVAVPTNGILVVGVAVGVIRALVDPGRPPGHGLALGIAALLLVPISSLYAPAGLLGIVSIEAGIVVAMLAGYSRRQYRVAEAQAQQLLEERVAAREEQARVAVLASRQQVARDIHDVLAHSLGGLVIQLDAVDALLEAGRVPDAVGRVHEARALAASGLAEARRAVDALRERPGSDRPARLGGRDLERDLQALAAEHRALGGAVDFTVTGAAAPTALAADAAEAVRRALQESLTNARKHAPGQAVTAELRWTPGGGCELRIENLLAAGDEAPSPSPSPSRAPVPSPGSPGGHGLVGMRERFDAVAGGRLSAGERDGRFVVIARLEPDPSGTGAPEAPGEERS